MILPSITFRLCPWLPSLRTDLKKLDADSVSGDFNALARTSEAYPPVHGQQLVSFISEPHIIRPMVFMCPTNRPAVLYDWSGVSCPACMYGRCVVSSSRPGTVHSTAPRLDPSVHATLDLRTVSLAMEFQPSHLWRQGYTREPWCARCGPIGTGRIVEVYCPAHARLRQRHATILWLLSVQQPCGRDKSMSNTLNPFTPWGTFNCLTTGQPAALHAKHGRCFFTWPS